MKDCAKPNRKTKLCVVYGFFVSHHTGAPITPSTISASENASVLVCGKNVLALNRFAGSEVIACVTQATTQMLNLPSLVSSRPPLVKWTTYG